MSSNKQYIEYEEDRIKVYRNKNEKKIRQYNIINGKLLDSYGIDKARYNSGSLEGTSIQKLLLNANGIFTDFKEEITKIIIDKSILKFVVEEVSCYIEICTSFDNK